MYCDNTIIERWFCSFIIFLYGYGNTSWSFRGWKKDGGNRDGSTNKMKKHEFLSDKAKIHAVLEAAGVLKNSDSTTLEIPGRKYYFTDEGDLRRIEDKETGVSVSGAIIEDTAVAALAIELMGEYKTKDRHSDIDVILEFVRLLKARLELSESAYDRIYRWYKNNRVEEKY